MKQIQFSTFGQPSVVARCVDVPDVDAPAAWEVVVRVEAFPINAADLAILAGRYGTLPKPPCSIGLEAVGVIQECGSSVTNVAVGDRVIILANNNWSEFRKVPAATVHKVSSDGDPVQLSMLKVNPATASMLLTNSPRLEPGEWIIQSAPLGSVGQCVIQLAKAAGLRTINIIRPTDSKADVIRLGGDVAIVDDHDLQRNVMATVGHSQIQLAVDAVAGPGTDHLANCLSENGSIIVYGMLSNQACRLTPENAIFRNISLRGFWLSKLLNRLTLDERTQLYNTLGEKLANGSLRLGVDSCFPITKIDEALLRAEQTGRKGKVVVTIA